MGDAQGVRVLWVSLGLVCVQYNKISQALCIPAFKSACYSRLILPIGHIVSRGCCSIVAYGNVGNVCVEMEYNLQLVWLPGQTRV